MIQNRQSSRLVQGTLLSQQIETHYIKYCTTLFHTMVHRRQNHHHRHRYHYSPHDASPHFPMLNVMIGIAVALCLWNIWTAPPPTVVTSSSTMDYAASKQAPNSAQQLQQEQQQQQQQQSMQQRVVEVPPTQLSSSALSNTSQASEQVDMHLFPVHTAANGQKYILLAPSRRSQKDTPRAKSVEPQQEGEFGQQPRGKTSTPKKTVVSHPPKTGGHGTTKTPKNKDMKKQHMKANRRGLSTPLFVDTVTYDTLSSSSSSSYPHHHLRPKWSSWFYGIAITGSVLAGGLFAKRALKRMDRWEQLSKEDSLAFDVAYTTAFVYDDDVDSYGSFAAAASDWSGDYMDRFDV